MTTVYDMNDVSLYRVRLDQKDYRWIAVTKDDNEAIELCRAIVRLEREGHIVQDVFAVSPNGVSVAMNLRGFKEFRQAEKSLRRRSLTLCSDAIAHRALISTLIARRTCAVTGYLI